MYSEESIYSWDFIIYTVYIFKLFFTSSESYFMTILPSLSNFNDYKINIYYYEVCLQQNHRSQQ